MKKFFLSLVMALMAVICMQAGNLGDVFEKTVRPVAVRAQDVPAEQVAAQGLKSASMAVLTPEAFAAAEAAVAELTPAVNETELGVNVKGYVNEDGENSELLVLISGQGQNMAMFMTGNADAIKKAL